MLLHVLAGQQHFPQGRAAFHLPLELDCSIAPAPTGMDVTFGELDEMMCRGIMIWHEVQLHRVVPCGHDIEQLHLMIVCLNEKNGQGFLG